MYLDLLRYSLDCGGLKLNLQSVRYVRQVMSSPQNLLVADCFTLKTKVTTVIYSDLVLNFLFYLILFCLILIVWVLEFKHKHASGMDLVAAVPFLCSGNLHGVIP